MSFFSSLLSSTPTKGGDDASVGPSAPGGPPAPAPDSGAGGGGPVHLCVVLDTSGSMSARTTSGDKEDFGFTMWDLARHCGVVAAASMRRGDTLSMVTYSDHPRLVARGIKYKTDGDGNVVQRITKALNSIGASGCTNMSDALKAAYDEMPAKPQAGASYCIVFCSDGEPTGDRRDPTQYVRELHESRPHVAVHTVSIGEGANHTLMRQLSEPSRGVFRFVSDGTMLGTTIISCLANVLRGGGPGARLEGVDREAVDMTVGVLDDNLNVRDASWAVKLRDTLKDMCAANPGNAVLEALLHDVREQVLLGLSSDAYYSKWGRAYIMSLCESLRARQRSNFKDHTSQLFSGDFVEHVNLIFNELPAVKPSAATAYSAPAPRSMRSYNNACGGCFTGESTVLMADGSSRAARDIVRGDRVFGGGVVDRVLVTRLPGPIEVVEVHPGVRLTPYHPVRAPGGAWAFPEHVRGGTRHLAPEVFNVLLRAGPPETQRLVMGAGAGVDVITLAHGVANDPVASHEYYGTDRVRDWVAGLEADADGRVHLDHQLMVVERDPRTMKVIGMRRSAADVSA